MLKKYHLIILFVFAVFALASLNMTYATYVNNKDIKLPYPVYVNNQDNYSHFLTLYVDGKESLAASVPGQSRKLIVYYYLKEGNHTFKLLTRDNCGFSKYVSYNKNAMDRKSIILPLNIGMDKCPLKKIIVWKKQIFNLKVNIVNKDSTGLFVTLYTGKNSSLGFTKYMYIPSSSNKTVPFQVKAGNYSVSLMWSYPYEAMVTRSEKQIEVENNTEIEMNIPRVIRHIEAYNPEGKISVIVENKDNNNLWVDLYVDDYAETRYVPSGQKVFYGEFTHLGQGQHTIKIRWLDPDTYRHTFKDSFSEEVENVTLGKNESRQVTISTYLFQ